MLMAQPYLKPLYFRIELFNKYIEVFQLFITKCCNCLETRYFLYNLKHILFIGLKRSIFLDLKHILCFRSSLTPYSTRYLIVISS